MDHTVASTQVEDQTLYEAWQALACLDREKNLESLGPSIAYKLRQPMCAIVASAAACSRWLSAEPSNFDRALRSLERIAHEGRPITMISAALSSPIRRSE